jgi:hypothetical protein
MNKYNFFQKNIVLQLLIHKLSLILHSNYSLFIINYSLY